MIFYNDEKKMFHLKTKNTSYIFGFYKEKVLLHLYWGKKIEGDLPDYGYFIDENRRRRNMNGVDYPDVYLSTDSVPMEFSTFGNTDLRSPTFHARYKDGSTVTALEYLSHSIYDGKPALSGLPATYVEDSTEAQTLELVLRDALTGLEITLIYTAFEELNAITRSVKVNNKGENDIRLEKVLSASVDFNNMDYDFIHLPGHWARERHVERNPLFTGTQIIDSAKGTSSSNHNPFFALVSKNATENCGEAYGFNLVYSGNFTAGVETDPFALSRAFIGINPFNFNFKLQPGDTFQSPEAVLVYSDNGIGGMSRIYHKLYRTRLCRGKFRDIERYVLLNNWEATYFKFDEEKIVNIAKKAAEVGIELLVLDDGWFGKRNNDHSSLGDWYVNTEKLPGGLTSLAKKVNDLGMKFGLWFEPEMISPDSDCYRAHPDWCIHVKDRYRSEGRNQLVLDLSREDVCDYIIDCISEHLSAANIEYVKWDYNRYMTNVGSALLEPDRQGEFYHRYMLGLYRVLETLVTRFPNVLFESCSSGGARFDAGMLYYMPQTWTSDDSDAVERVFIQNGTSFCYPYCTMGAHVSAVPNHQVHRVTPISARGHVAMPGQFGYELDLNKLQDYEIEAVKQQIKDYKAYGEVFHKGDLYRLTEADNRDFAVNEFVSEDGNTVIVTLFCVKATPNDVVHHIKLQGLQHGATYKRVDTDIEFSADFLMNFGINKCFVKDYENEILVFKKV